LKASKLVAITFFNRDGSVALADDNMPAEDYSRFMDDLGFTKQEKEDFRVEFLTRFSPTSIN
jgi:hypothetical protein